MVIKNVVFIPPCASVFSLLRVQFSASSTINQVEAYVQQMRSYTYSTTMRNYIDSERLAKIQRRNIFVKLISRKRRVSLVFFPICVETPVVVLRKSPKHIFEKFKCSSSCPLRFGDKFCLVSLPKRSFDSRERRVNGTKLSPTRLPCGLPLPSPRVAMIYAIPISWLLYPARSSQCMA